jgi:hypothetical protein
MSYLPVCKICPLKLNPIGTRPMLNQGKTASYSFCFKCLDLITSYVS